MANYTDIFPSTVTLETEVGDVTTLTTDAKDSTVSAVNELKGDIGSETLTTTSQTLGGAVNELDAEIGTDTLTTTAQTLSGAINELDGVENIEVRTVASAPVDITGKDLDYWIDSTTSWTYQRMQGVYYRVCNRLQNAHLNGTIDNVSMIANLNTATWFTNYSGGVANGSFAIAQATGIINVPEANNYEVVIWVQADLDANRDVNTYLNVEINNGTTTSVVLADTQFVGGSGGGGGTLQTMATWKATSTIAIPAGTLDVTGAVGTGTNVRMGLSTDEAVAYTNMKASIHITMVS